MQWGIRARGFWVSTTAPLVLGEQPSHMRLVQPTHTDASSKKIRVEKAPTGLGHCWLLPPRKCWQATGNLAPSSRSTDPDQSRWHGTSKARRYRVEAISLSRHLPQPPAYTSPASGRPRPGAQLLKANIQPEMVQGAPQYAFPVCQSDTTRTQRFLPFVTLLFPV